MDLNLSEEHEALRATVEEFARKEVAPVIGDLYEREEFPYEIVAQDGRDGPVRAAHRRGVRRHGRRLLRALPGPGGAGPGRLVGGDHPGGRGVAGRDADLPVRHRRSRSSEWLPALAAGEKLGAFGLTEPGGGSDAGATRTTARLDGDEWVINGSKAFITNSGTDITSLVTVTAITGGRDVAGRREISAIMVPAGTPGLPGVARSTPRSAGRAPTPASCSSTTCRVPAANLVGERGRGYAQFLSILDEGRVAIAALSVGLAQGCVDESVRYAHEREAFGHQIGQLPGHPVQDRRHGGAGAHRAAGLLRGRGEDAGRASRSRRRRRSPSWSPSNAAMDNARDATQIFGGYGFMNEYPVGRFYRDAKILEIGEGTSEVQRMLIARELGL